MEYKSSNSIIMVCIASAIFVPTNKIMIVPVLMGIVAASYKMLFKSDEINFENIGLITKDGKCPVCINKRETDTCEQRVYHIPEGLSYEKILSKQSEIENVMKRKVKIEIADNYNVVITSFTKQLGKMYMFTREIVQKRIMQFTVGYSLTMGGEEIQKIDLNTSDCHMLIAGSTGSGKSEFLRHILSQAIIQSDGDEKKVQLNIARSEERRVGKEC